LYSAPCTWQASSITNSPCAGNLQNGIHIRRLAEEMHRNNGFRPGGDGPLEQSRVHRVGVFLRCDSRRAGFSWPSRNAGTPAWRSRPLRWRGSSRVRSAASRLRPAMPPCPSPCRIEHDEGELLARTIGAGALPFEDPAKGVERGDVGKGSMIPEDGEGVCQVPKAHPFQRCPISACRGIPVCRSGAC